MLSKKMCSLRGFKLNFHGKTKATQVFLNSLGIFTPMFQLCPCSIVYIYLIYVHNIPHSNSIDGMNV